jgi:hypothetical protein
MPTTMQDNSRQIALSILRPDEKLLWSGQPAPGRIALQTWPIFVIALPWTGFALYWAGTSTGFTMPDLSVPTPLIFFPFVGAVGCLIGLTLLALPFMAWRRARRTVYAVTDQRCLTVISNSRRYVSTHIDQDIGRVKCIERSGGSGDLIFSPSTSTDAAKDLTRVGTTGFYGIDEVRHVEDIVRQQFTRKEG